MRISFLAVAATAFLAAMNCPEATAIALQGHGHEGENTTTDSST